jgi:hypothetical protein
MVPDQSSLQQRSVVEKQKRPKFKHPEQVNQKGKEEKLHGGIVDATSNLFNTKKQCKN